MAIKYNVPTSMNGIPIAAGVIGIIKFVSPFTPYTRNKEGEPVPNYNAQFELRNFKSLDDYKLNQMNFFTSNLKEIPRAGEMILTKEEAITLTAIDAEKRIKDWCETYLGVGSCEIIDLFP